MAGQVANRQINARNFRALSDRLQNQATQARAREEITNSEFRAVVAGLAMQAILLESRHQSPSSNGSTTIPYHVNLPQNALPSWRAVSSKLFNSNNQRARSLGGELDDLGEQVANGQTNSRSFRTFSDSLQGQATRARARGEITDSEFQAVVAGLAMQAVLLEVRR